MMEYELTLDKLLLRANRLYSNREIVTWQKGDEKHRYTYGDYFERVCKLCNVLEDLGIEKSDHIGIMGYNDFRFFEHYFGNPCYGSIMHTLNPRLRSEFLAHCINDANDRVVFSEADMLPLLEQVKDNVDVERYVVLGEEIPDTSLEPISSYENLMDNASKNFEFPEHSEWDKWGMCHTTGTTGAPKGVHYTHRAMYLHTMAACMTIATGFKESDVLLVWTPMFHANAWGSPYVGTMVGAKLVFPGSGMTDAEVIADLIEQEEVTSSSAVPTLLRMLMEHVKEENRDISNIRQIACGGSAPSKDLLKTYREEFDAPILHAWGMTETSPMATVTRLRTEIEDLSKEKKYDYWAKQGLPVPGVELKVLNENGEEVEWNDEEMGEIVVKGPWIAKEYHNRPEANEESFDEDGWFHTRDIATVDEWGYISLKDRKDDLVKSGGEWISTVELENAIMKHPSVREATVFRVAHEKYDERPLAMVVKDGDLSKEEILDYLREDFPKWWIPEDVIFSEQIPKTSVGKFDKAKLMEEYKDYLLED